MLLIKGSHQNKQNLFTFPYSLRKAKIEGQCFGPGLGLYQLKYTASLDLNLYHFVNKSAWCHTKHFLYSEK